MSKLSKSSSKFSIGASIVSAIFFFFLLRTFVSHRITFFDKILSIGITPALWFYNSYITPLQKKYHDYNNYKELVTERDFYKDKYVQTQATLIQYQATYAFNQATERLEKFSKRYLKDTSFLCKVLLHRLSDSEQVMIINAGSRHGVTKNMLAIYGSTLLGRINEIFPYYSSIQLITDKRSRISIYCAHTKTKGIIEGKNDKNLLSLSYVDCLQPLEAHDLLISSGEGTLFPEGFCVGKIHSYIPQELHYIVKVTPCYDLKTIDYCYLIPYENCSYTQVTDKQ